MHCSVAGVFAAAVRIDRQVLPSFIKPGIVSVSISGASSRRMRRIERWKM